MAPTGGNNGRPIPRCHDVQGPSSRSICQDKTPVKEVAHVSHLRNTIRHDGVRNIESRTVWRRIVRLHIILWRSIFRITRLKNQHMKNHFQDYEAPYQHMQESQESKEFEVEEKQQPD